MLSSEQRVETIYEAIDINIKHSELVCIVGAGGKTTTMFKLSRELKALGKRVLVTTSTAIYYPAKENIDKIIVKDHPSRMDYRDVSEGSITVMGREVSQEGKLLGLSIEHIDNIFREQFYDFILVEGDGAKSKPLKAPADHEPVIPVETTIILGLIGLDSAGREIDEENVHRAEIFCNITKSSLHDIIDEKKILDLILSDRGLFKGAGIKTKKYLILNKAEDEKRKRFAYGISDLLRKSRCKLDGIIISTLINDVIIKE